MIKKSKSPEATGVDARDSGYEVGYGKPPKANQFQRGTSGHLKGRPLGTKNFATSFRNVATEKLSVTQNGQRWEMPAYEAVVRKLRQEALAGKVKSVQMFLELMREHCPEQLTQEIKKTLAADDLELIANHLSRNRGPAEDAAVTDVARPANSPPTPDSEI